MDCWSLMKSMLIQLKGQSGSPGVRRDNLGHQLFETLEHPTLEQMVIALQRILWRGQFFFENSPTYFLSGPVTVAITFIVRPGCIVILPRVPGGKRISKRNWQTWTLQSSFLKPYQKLISCCEFVYTVLSSQGVQSCLHAQITCCCTLVMSKYSRIFNSMCICFFSQCYICIA